MSTTGIDGPVSRFEQIAAAGRRPGLIGDFWYLLRANQKWWLLPILAILLGFGVMMFLSGTAAASFIYTLF